MAADTGPRIRGGFSATAFATIVSADVSAGKDDDVVAAVVAPVGLSAIAVNSAAGA